MTRLTCCARDSPKHDVYATRPESYAQYLKLPEEVQIRYGFPEYPTCTPGTSDASFGNSQEEIDALVKLLPSNMQPFLLGHELKSEV